MIEEMKALAKRRDMCVLATVADGVPHCSLMAYVTDEDCREIYMVTNKKTQKFKNLIQNPSVSLLIDTRDEHPGGHRRETKALTVSGLCQEIGDEDKITMVRAKLLETHPQLQTFFDDPDVGVVSVKITSFLLLDGLKEAHFEELSQIM
jgi:nitroimidazol reductase NimA-like FMN-containing flavoprotein (pyridoxamine 5'-phosphate oxidase superfamily)